MSPVLSTGILTSLFCKVWGVAPLTQNYLAVVLTTTTNHNLVSAWSTADEALSPLIATMGNQLSTSNTLALNPPGPPDRLSVSQHGSSTGSMNRGDWTTVRTKGNKIKMKQDLVKQDQVMQGLVIHDSVTHDSVMQDQKKQDQVNWRGSASSSKDELCTKVPKWCIANTSCSKFIGKAIHGGY